MEQEFTPAEAFPPGEYIRDELEARGWTQLDLAAILDRPASVIQDILKGSRPISPEIAQGLGDAFGTTAQYWMNYQTAYKLALTPKDDKIMRRAKLFQKYPIREMQRRGWIEDSSNVNVIETQVCQFFDIPDIDTEPRLQYAARKTDYAKENESQKTWLRRAMNLATMFPVEGKYDENNIDALLTELAQLRKEPEELRSVPQLLSKFGIRFLIVEHLPKTKIDGACFWLDKNSPVIVMSLRFDRIDYFWFTLIHELKHVYNKDGTIVESELFEEYNSDQEKPKAEQDADTFAVNFLVNQEELDDMILRKYPMISKIDILVFAHRQGLHPGIVVGQLHHRYKNWSNFRQLLVKIRSIIIPIAVTDGWGQTISL